MSCNCDESTSSSRSSKYEMLEVAKALSIVLTEATSETKAQKPLAQALNCILAESVFSREALPPFRASVMDGYAVISSDGVGEFPVIRHIAAGDVVDFSISSGKIAYITTGAPLPEGADAVVKVEDTRESSNSTIHIMESVQPGENIRPIGSDVAENTKVLSSGQLLKAAEIGLLATVGVSSVLVHTQPIVGVLSTGSELEEPDCLELKKGKIRDSNRPMLLAAIADGGIGQPCDLGKCVDSSEDIDDFIRAALEKCDVLITSGGVSMGDHDLIKPLLEKIGTVHFGRLMMKPGKPTTFATVEVNGKKKLVFGLPGNPVSSLVTFHLLVSPALRRLSGFAVNDCYHSEIEVSTAHEFKLDPVRPEYHRVLLTYDADQNIFVAESTGRQASSRLLSCLNTDGLLCLPTGISMPENTRATVLLLNNTLPTRPSKQSYLGKSHKEQVVNTGRKKSPKERLKLRLGILTISDRASRGECEDHSGPAIRKYFQQHFSDQFEVVKIENKIVSDEKVEIQNVICQWTEKEQQMNLILTTGGTGFSPRDVTPEAVKELLHRETPGIVIGIMMASLQITPMAVLSRPVAGIRHNSLVITFPGKPKAVVENLTVIKKILPHALHLIGDFSHSHHVGKNSK